ncbi:glycosyltransferase family 2 protein [Vibrio campbellii]|uniref:glycosyltransferase family 2 protein n=1 Tax=Vibrio campbellii TaxID=680 RepID=UPI0015C413FB|nr:glycosyltransferase family 2 protein [Vibrio campbellii]
MNINKVSVVIPVYNRANTIVKSINSVLSQTGDFLIEILVVDDYSDDRDLLLSNLSAISEGMDDSRFDLKVILHEENRHGGAARNSGVKQSTGDVIAFLDSDDVWVEDKLESCCKVLSENSYDFVYHQLTYNNSNVIIPARRVNDGESYMDYLICSNGSMQTSTLVFKKDIFTRIDFSEDLKKYQDFDLIYKCEKSGLRVGFIPRVMTIMDNNPNSVRISNSFDPDKSIYWMNKVGDGISSKAKNTFIMARIVKYYCLSGDKITGLKFAIHNVSFDRSLFSCYKYFSFILCPLVIINCVKKVKNFFLR